MANLFRCGGGSAATIEFVSSGQSRSYRSGQQYYNYESNEFMMFKNSGGKSNLKINAQKTVGTTTTNAISATMYVYAYTTPDVVANGGAAISSKEGSVNLSISPKDFEYSLLDENGKPYEYFKVSTTIGLSTATYTASVNINSIEVK